MHYTSNAEEIQVFFEMAMSVGTSNNLIEMSKNALLTYLRKLNCSFGAIYKLKLTEHSSYYYEKILSIPFKNKDENKFNIFNKLIPQCLSLEELCVFEAEMPIEHAILPDKFYYILKLENYGILLLKKNSFPLNESILFTLRSVNLKLAQACISCEQNKKLIAAKERAEKSDRLKTAFIENISHEIRTPLNAIIGYSTLIADDHIKGNMLKQACNAIINGSNNLLNMVESLLDISLLESGNLKLKYTLCNINQILIELDQIFFKHIEREQKGDQLSFKIASPLSELFLVTDIVRVTQIFDKLISNAVRFSEIGEIEVGYNRFERKKKDDLPVNLIFYVKDKGIGIEKEEQSTIFKPFNRIYDSREKLYSGIGTGLTIVKHLVDLLEGEIWIESTPGKGSAFYFSIPTLRTVDELVSSL